MKTSSGLLAAVLFLSVVSFAHAGNFISQVLDHDQMVTIALNGGHVLIIRNFTQEVGCFNKGYVSVTKNGSTITNAFVASIEDPTTNFSTDPINTFYVAGPATVAVTCGDTTSCFITYRKAEE